MTTNPKVVQQEATDLLTTVGKMMVAGNAEAAAEGLAIVAAYVTELVDIEAQFAAAAGSWFKAFGLIIKIVDGKLVAPISSLRPQLQSYVAKYKT